MTSAIKKYTDNIFVNGEQRFFIASDVTAELLEKIKDEIQDGGITSVVADTTNVHVTVSQDGKTAYIGVDKDASFITTQTTYAQVRNLINRGILPILRHEFAADDVWYLALKEDDSDISTMYFAGPTSISGVFAYAELNSSGWTAPRTYGLATQDALQSERQARVSADSNLQEQIDNVHIDVDDSLSTDSTNPVENRVVAESLNGKQDTLTEMTDQEIDDLINSLQ